MLAENSIILHINCEAIISEAIIVLLSPLNLKNTTVWGREGSVVSPLDRSKALIRKSSDESSLNHGVMGKVNLVQLYCSFWFQLSIAPQSVLSFAVVLKCVFVSVLYTCYIHASE